MAYHVGVLESLWRSCWDAAAACELQIISHIHAFKPSTEEAEASLNYMRSSRTAGATKRESVSKAQVPLFNPGIESQR